MNIWRPWVPNKAIQVKIMSTITGTVKWFNESKGFGFIEQFLFFKRKKGALSAPFFVGCSLDLVFKLLLTR